MNINRFLATFVVLLLAAGLQAQEFRGASIGLRVSNMADRSNLLVLGVREGASTGLDLTLEEYELPPVPPNEIFDVRVISTPGQSQLGSGSVRDYRPVQSTTEAFTVTYTIAWQAGEGSSSVEVTWESPYPSRVTAMTIDGEDMAGKQSWTSQTPQGQATVRVTFNYKPLEFIVTPATLTFDVNDRVNLPSTDVQLVTQNDNNAAWLASADVAWLTLTPNNGNGDEMVRVAVNTSDLPRGNYTGTVRFRSPVYPAQTDVPVTMSITVGIAAPPLAETPALLGNFPNPFRSQTAVRVRLGADADHAVTLRIFDALGRVVADLSSAVEARPDMQQITFSGEDLPPGVYTCRLEHGGRFWTRSMVLLK